MKNLKYKYIVVIILSTLSYNLNAQNWSWNPPWLSTVSDRVGVGKGQPIYRLDVANHITIDTLIIYPTSTSYIGCYMIGDTTVLHNYGIQNIFCGAGTGVNINAATGFGNSFFGHFAGNATTSANANTFIGSSSGRSTSTGNTNTFVGFNSGTL